VSYCNKVGHKVLELAEHSIHCFGLPVLAQITLLLFVWYVVTYIRVQCTALNMMSLDEHGMEDNGQWVVIALLKCEERLRVDHPKNTCIVT
jgi:hypothetical protein